MGALDFARTALAAALAACLLIGCKKKPDPLGKHRGFCSVNYKTLSDPNAQSPTSEACPDQFEVFNDGDGLKVDLGDCTIHLKAPVSSDDTEWKLASPAPCLTKKGPARMAEGKLYLVGDSFNLSFAGSTDDKRFAVSWGFTSDPGLR